MRIAHPRRRGRPAFTLIEMLVVIAIIAVLSSLLLAGVFGALNRANEMSCRTEIGQLDNAITSWRSAYKVTFPPPSQLFLSNTRANFDVNDAQAAVRKQSLQYLTVLWPHLDWTSIASNGWSGNAGTMPNGGVFLQGDQCLAFFLGGIPMKDNNGAFVASGFSDNPKDPTVQGGGRVGPFFEFKAGRLFQRVAGNPFLSYSDSWGNGKVPYVYFSSMSSAKKTNSYNPADAFAVTNADNSSTTVAPYWSSSVGAVKQYLNPNTCQIISAGRDGKFGAGGQWNPAVGAINDLKMRDDQSNFSDSLLGVAQ